MTADEAAGGLKSFAVYDPTWVSGGMSIPAAEPKEREEAQDLNWAEDGEMCVGFVTAAQ
jgi:hypothetical protein